MLNETLNDTKNRISKTVIELFAGVGGFRLGLNNSSADWSFVWFNQWEPNRKTQYAYDCYISHFGIKESYSNDDLEKWEYLKGSKKITRKTKDGYEYSFSEGAIPFLDPINKSAQTMLTSESTKNRSTHII